jgi:SAM-dependent methyltransferase
LTDQYYQITEITGDLVSQEQVERMTHRYVWAGKYCKGKDVLEVGCGTGPGLTYLSGLARSLAAGDYSQQMVDICQRRLGPQIRLSQFDAQQLPFEDRSLDVVIMFEALYYVPDAERFFAECRRVLRPGGRVLVANANRDLYDFNPSPNSFVYHGTTELAAACRRHGFVPELFGHLPVTTVSMRQRILRPAKKLAVALGLMPTTNDGKKWLKRIVFGRLVPLPSDIDASAFVLTQPTPLAPDAPDRVHKVIYCCGTLPG